MHINADQLREYKFDLLSPHKTAEISLHLKNCPECAKKFQTLGTQFQALEVLNEQPEVSEERLNAVLVESRKVRKSKVIPFRTAAILAAAAGIAMVLVFHFKDGGASSTSTDSTGRTARRAVPAQHRPAGVPPAPPLSLAELRATQPFAPASNIELNVLPRRDEVQLTIYNAEDLTLVREKRKLVLKRGWNWLQFMWSNTLIDPTSLELQPVTHADQIEITQLVYPPRLNELARWSIFSEHSGEAEFKLTYFTSGLKWSAVYEATLAPDEQTMHLRSHVRIDNASGEDYENAQTRLVVGEINLREQIAALAKRQHAFGSPRPLRRKRITTKSSDKFNLAMPEIMGVSGGLGRVGYDDAIIVQKQILKKALSEYQLYTIEGRETIPDGWGKRLPNIEAHEIGVTNLYKFEAERWGGQTSRFLSFANTEAHHLGDIPLPKGQVRVFKKVDAASSRVAKERPVGRNEAGCLIYIGASRLQYIPVGEEIELELGEATKVTVEPKLMRTRTGNFEFDPKGNISGWDEITDWSIELTNSRDLPVEIEVMRWAGSNHWKIETAAAVEKYDASHFRFTAKVEPRSKRQIEYELTVHHGTRQETND